MPLTKPNSTSFKKGNIPWNKGLTKEVDNRMCKNTKYSNMNRLSKNCPSCGNTMIYSTKYNYIYSVRDDKKCNSCANKGTGNPNLGYYKRTPEINKKSRLSAIKRIEENKLNGGQLVPRYNPKACQIFEQIMKENGVHIQHAENGGEFHIKELGYWVDGYDKENNIVYEYDENWHRQQDEKDILRQQQIEKFLKCDFIRIKENNDE